MTGTSTKVRFVRCPRCRGILLESPNVPLYKCGGCDATLRAKNRKETVESASSGTLDDNPARNNELEQASPRKELICSSQELNLCPTEASMQVESEDLGKGQSGSSIISKGISLSDELHCQEKKEMSEAGGSTEADGSNEVDYGFSSPDNQLVSECYSTTCTPHMPSDESVPSLNDNSSSNEELEQSQEVILPDSDQARSSDTVETTEVTNEHKTSEEDKLSGRGVTGENNIPEDNNIQGEDKLCDREGTDEKNISVEDKVDDRLIYISKSPTTRSSHAYDGSVSSYEGWDDQVPDQHSHLFTKGLFEPRRVSENFGMDGRPTRADVAVSNKMSTNIDLPLQIQYEKFSSMSLNEKQHPDIMDKNVNVDQDGLQDCTIYGIEEQEEIHLHNFEGTRPVQKRMPSDGDEIVSGKTIYRKVSSAGYQNGGSSALRNKKFLYKSGLHSPDEIPYNQLELLRKVDELRDHLHRSYTRRGKTNGKFPVRGTEQEMEQPVYYNHEPSEHPWNLSRVYRPSKSVPFHCGPSRVHFSGKPTDCRHHVDYTCLHACAEQWQCPLQMPLPNLCYNNPGHVCYHPCWTSVSKFPLRGGNSEPLPHDQRHMDHKLEKLFHRERRNPIKRHYRPIAGGSPIVICYSCRKLVQLPADFLLSSKRYHKLRCGSCSEVLIFQFHNGTNVPFRPNMAVPPPSEVDNSSDATTTRILASKFHASEVPKRDGMLYSKGYEVSISKQSRNKHESSEEASSSSQGLSGSKLEKQSPVKGMQRSSGSPLHRLMGYSSPTQMIKGS